MPQYLRFVTLDVFTTEPFAGNPLAVVFLPSEETSTPLTQSQKQLIAREFNYSETIFVHPAAAGSSEDNRRQIDIFTTEQELPFAGHPTIGAACWFLRHSPDAHERRVVNTLVTKAGAIPIAPLSLRFGSAGDAGDESTAPVTARIAHNVRIHAARFPLSELLRLHPSLGPFLQKESYAEGFPIVSIVKGMTQIHVRLPSLEALAAVTGSTGGEMVKSKSVAQGGYLDEGWESDEDGLVVIYFHVRDVFDTVSNKEVIRTRMFLGTLEDPATGSAASGLAAYLALTESEEQTTRYECDIVQGVEMGRRSDIGLEVVLAADRKRIESVELRGSSVKVSEGQILVK
ncbi:hypothetical protein VTN77DRAFT_9341 [Rasamsonia byssochlamydoides]|uniref:uncharacterized protein n=1 Tax=Rasamsonia byssochlamydoides TaxID=89139 RepID=UPI00374321D2